MSEYWEAPINQLDWEVRTARLLIEAVCNFIGTALPFEDSRRLTSEGARLAQNTSD
jgi:hypothetical protein